MPADFHENLDRPLDYLRIEIGDVGANGVFMVQNETLTALLDNTSYNSYPNPYSARVAFLLRGLIARYASAPTKVSQFGGTTQEWLDRLKSWKELLDQAKKGALIDPIVGTSSGAAVSSYSENEVRW